MRADLLTLGSTMANFDVLSILHRKRYNRYNKAHLEPVRYRAVIRTEKGWEDFIDLLESVRKSDYNRSAYGKPPSYPCIVTTKLATSEDRLRFETYVGWESEFLSYDDVVDMANAIGL